jgi:hypothetical protein
MYGEWTTADANKGWMQQRTHKSFGALETLHMMMECNHALISHAMTQQPMFWGCVGVCKAT